MIQKKTQNLNNITGECYLILARHRPLKYDVIIYASATVGLLQFGLECSCVCMCVNTQYMKSEDLKSEEITYVVTMANLIY